MLDQLTRDELIEAPVEARIALRSCIYMHLHAKARDRIRHRGGLRT